MASKIEDVKAVVREVTIQGLECYVTVGPEGIGVSRKGDKHQRDKRALTIAWDQLMDYMSPNVPPSDPDEYTPTGYLKYETT